MSKTIFRPAPPFKGPFKCYVTLFSWKLDPHPPPHNANNVEPYTFVTLFPGKFDPPTPHLRYVTLEWALKVNTSTSSTESSNHIMLAVNPFLVFLTHHILLLYAYLRNKQYYYKLSTQIMTHILETNNLTKL